MRSTWATLRTPCSARLTTSSTKYDSCSGVLPGEIAAYVTIGRPITSTRWINGSVTFCGRLERTLVTASLTSVSARSVLVSSANWIVVSDNPSVIEEEICRTPSTPGTPSSMVLLTSDSSSAGAAPKCDTATEITGMSADGSRVTASFVKLTQPSTNRMIENTIEGSGFRIDHAEILSAISVPACDRGPRRTWS